MFKGSRTHTVKQVQKQTVNLEIKSALKMWYLKYNISVEFGNAEFISYFHPKNKICIESWLF